MLNKFIKIFSKKNYSIVSTYTNKKPKKIQNVKFVKFDLMSNRFDIKIFKNVDTVFVCSANSSGARVMTNNPASHFEDNLMMNLNIVKNLQFSRIKKIIFLKQLKLYTQIQKICDEKSVNYTFSKNITS